MKYDLINQTNILKIMEKWKQLHFMLQTYNGDLTQFFTNYLMTPQYCEKMKMNAMSRNENSNHFCNNIKLVFYSGLYLLGLGS